jgi:hypothetical protein
VGDSQQLALQMQHAEERGDRRAARALAQAILDSAPNDPPEGGGDEAPAAALDPAKARHQAAELLARTQPDAFLLVVGLLGLGAMVWLVYNYIL